VKNDNTSITAFNFEDRQVRAFSRDGEPWFVLSDLCQVLEIAEPHRAASRLDDDEKDRHTMTTLGGPQEVTIINESGLFSLTLTSRKPEAKRFKKWVTSEVLPAIRKTGSYGAPVANLNDPDTLRGLLFDYATEVKALRESVSEQAPVVKAFNRLETATEGTMCITNAAKCLQIRPKVLFDWLEEQDWIYRRVGSTTLLGYEKITKQGLLEHKLTSVTTDGVEKIRTQVLVTAKGLAHLSKAFSAPVQAAA